MLATRKENYQYFLEVQSVKLHCVCFIQFCHIAIAIVKVHSFRQFSLNFFVGFHDKIASSRQRSYYWMVIFQLLVKFHEISWIYQNFAEKGKFCGSARNSAACGKL